MAQQHKIGRVNTTRGKDKDTGFYIVKYHATNVVQFNDDIIILDNGGYRTQTTKTRMNQTSNEFGLGFQVFQRDYEWFIRWNGEELPFNETQVTLNR